MKSNKIVLGHLPFKPSPHALLVVVQVEAYNNPTRRWNGGVLPGWGFALAAGSWRRPSAAAGKVSLVVTAGLAVNGSPSFVD